ncbi:MAG: hypothetical protein JWO59_2343, partial [Chloroflexi bacterium]|nr:hypothetical protein [Chloroflexota bacterium]
MLDPVMPRLRRIAASRINPRLSLAIVAAHAASAASAILRRGGTSLPGLVSLRIEPDCVRLLAGQLGDGSIVVAGTNGKTTTSALIADALRAGGKHVLHNRAGSNMARGIATTLARESGIAGNVKAASRLTGLFEVDEAALPGVLAQVTPRVLVLTNL